MSERQKEPRMGLLWTFIDEIQEKKARKMKRQSIVRA
jgi:hypothetical protein